MVLAASTMDVPGVTEITLLVMIWCARIDRFSKYRRVNATPL
jgi:hypothetical protein